ncbi:MAG: sulfurtransferase [Gammaproteobacteria bacterium]
MANALISITELAGQLSESVVFDCRFSLADFAAGRQQYEAGHIPGAFHLDMETDLAGDNTTELGRHPLPRRADFESRLRACGVNSTSRIVLYDANRFAGAARAWWLLRYWGCDDVRLLNGGFGSWSAAGHGVETGSAVPTTTGNVTLSTGTPGALMDSATVRATVRSQSRVIVDSRETERFLGHSEPIDPVAGCIAGALNAPWQAVTNVDGMALDATQQRARWQAVGAGDSPIVYCGSGVTACVNLLSRELAGLSAGTLYNGGWSEWCALSQSED